MEIGVFGTPLLAEELIYTLIILAGIGVRNQ